MRETWIGVTGFYATDNPHPGLAVARALRRADPSWRVVALAWDRFGTGAFADDLIDAHALVPYPSAGPRELLARILALKACHPLDVVIPTVDAEQAHWVALRRSLARIGIRTCLPAGSALRAREKRRLPALGRRAGVPVPPTLVLPSPAAAERAAARCRYPQVLKGAHVDSVIVHSADDFAVAAWQLAEQWGWPLLAQPVIAGEEYDVAAVARRGTLVATAVMKKLAVTSKGTAWAGVTVDDPRFVAPLERLARALAWDGAIEAEFLLGPDGVLTCFEVNPRFPSWIALAVESGANLPAILVRMALGDEAGACRATAGRLFARALVERVYTTDPLTALDARRVRRGLLGGTPSGAGSARSGRGADRPPGGGTVAITGLNAADNPSPGLTVAHALRAASASVRLVGLTHEVLSTAAYVDGAFDEVRLLPFPSREDGYPEALVAACRQAGADCLLPTLDVEVPVVSWLARGLAAAGIATLVPSPEALHAVAKSRLPALRDLGFRLPRTLAVVALEDVPLAGRELGLPFVLKGPVADARIVRSDREAHVVARRLAGTWGWPLLAQEYVEGEEFGVAAVADRRHRVVGCVTVRKSIRTANGNTWGGTALDDAALRVLADRLAGALGWVGPFELEVIRHARRGTLLIEVNPRFPAWVFLSAGAGANLPWAAVRLARGERVAPLRPRPRVFYVRMAWDVTAPVERMADLAVKGRVTGRVE
jgi:carbamoyl-phosphate synthase large subunit